MSSAPESKECKRKEKASRKFPNSLPFADNQVEVCADEFDVDLVMKRVPCPNDTERVVSTKKYFSKSRKHGSQSHSKKNASGSQSKKSLTFSQIAGSSEIIKEIAACLSPMGASQRRISFSEFSTDKIDSRL